MSSRIDLDNHSLKVSSNAKNEGVEVDKNVFDGFIDTTRKNINVCDNNIDLMSKIDSNFPVLPLNSSKKIDKQRHLAYNLSTAQNIRHGKTDDDIPRENEVNAISIENKSVEAKIEKKSSVKSIIEHFDGKRMIKRGEIRLSPKTKVSPKLCPNPSKAKWLIEGGSQESPKMNQKMKPKLKVRTKNETENVIFDAEVRNPVNAKKVESIVAAFESNTTLKEDDPNNDDTTSKKCLVVNAFSKLMNSKGGGASPTPGKKRVKRLEKVKTTGGQQIERWLRKEKE